MTVAGINTNHPDVIPLPDVAAALVRSEGNISKAARDLSIRRSSLKTRIDTHPELQVLLMDLRDEIIDVAEDNVFKDVKAGDGGASRFVLSTIGKERGWVTRQENANKEPIEITVRNFSDRGEDGPDQDQAGS